MDHTVNDNSSVYYGNTYWNDLPEVVAWLSTKISGRPDRYWGEHLAATGHTFKRALILNCGNGNVEQGLLNAGVMDEAIGVDYSESLLAEARTAAEAGGLAARYEQLDTNTAAFPDDDFDLVVNHAAAHHIAYIDKVFRELARRLGEHGTFVSHDYIGAHRNQYDWVTWDAAATVNRSLPEHLQQEMAYPHLPTMLATDPTEAIHSELIMATMRRYFRIDELVPLGGAIAYLLLTHNERLFAADPDDPDRRAMIETVLAADDAFTAAHPELTLFAFLVARPDANVWNDEAQLAAWTAEEEAREAAARDDGGRYYPLTTLQATMLGWEDTRVEALHARSHADHLLGENEHLHEAYRQLEERNRELQQQCEALEAHDAALQARYDQIMARPPYRQLRWLARSSVGVKLRQSDRFRSALARLRGRAGR